MRGTTSLKVCLSRIGRRLRGRGGWLRSGGLMMGSVIGWTGPTVGFGGPLQGEGLGRLFDDPAAYGGVGWGVPGGLEVGAGALDYQ